MTYRTPDLAAECDALRAEVSALRATTPYRTAPVAPPRPLAWLARALLGRDPAEDAVDFFAYHAALVVNNHSAQWRRIHPVVVH